MLTASGTPLRGTVRQANRLTKWEKDETRGRDAAASTIIFTLLRGERKVRSAHPSDRRVGTPLQAARPLTPLSSGSLRTRASDSLSWPTAPATLFSTLPCCKERGTTWANRRPSSASRSDRVD